MSDPNHVTHVPVRVDLPNDDTFELEREPLPTPSLFQPGVKVVNKKSGLENIIRHVEYKTNQFRPVFDRLGKPAGRTVWESFEEWSPVVEPSPAEKERLAAASKLEEELAKLSADDLAAVQVLVDDEDATKALAKLEAMRRLGVIKKAGK